MSTSPMAAQCQHACKRFALSVELYWSTAYKLFLPINIDDVCQKCHYKACTLLYTAVHGLPF